ncbi:MAG: hypothetical protein AAGA18_13340, partial [Verrucomicrobiota bacterium]
KKFNSKFSFSNDRYSIFHDTSRITKFMVPLAIFLVTVIGNFIVMKDFPLSADEALIKFQADCYRQFKIGGILPTNLVPTHNIFFLSYQYYNESSTGWTSQYLPVYAFFYAVLSTANLEFLLGAIMNCVSLVMVWHIAKILWPQDKELPWICVIFLGSSSQFLITGMTYYTMNGHLAINLIWLWLFLKNKTWATLLLPWVGALAIGMHQPHIHAHMAIPCLLLVPFKKKWWETAYIVIIYLLACYIWYSFLTHVRNSDPNEIMNQSLGLPSAISIIVRLMNVFLLINWSNIVAGLLCIYALNRYKNMPFSIRLIALSFIVSFFFYLLFPGTGGHGWGSRYSHCILGHMVLLAGYGYQLLKEFLCHNLLKRFVCVFTLFALLIQLPLRCYQSSSFVTPYARLFDHISTLDVDYVGIKFLEGYYVLDMVRNDPFFRNRPIFFRSNNTDLKEKLGLEDETVTYIGAEEFKKFGIPLTDPEEIERVREMGLID